MRIGIDVSSVSGWRGPSRNVNNLIRTLSTIGPDHKFFWFHPLPIEWTNIQNKNIATVYVPIKRGMPWLNITLPLSVRKYNLDVFLFPGSDYWLWKPMKTIVLTRTYDIVAWDASLLERLRAYLKRVSLKYVADKIGAVSQFNASQIKINCDIEPSKIEVVYNAVDPNFQDISIQPVKGYGDYILYCGGTEKLKNIEGLLKAYDILVRRGVKNKLVLVGGKYSTVGGDMKDYVELIESLGLNGRVLLHGIEKDIRALAGIYKGASLVVFPSFHESFGMVSVEAMAAGVPLVASNATAIPEICGDAALYFDPHSPEDMANKIEAVLYDKIIRQEIIAKGYQQVKKYSWEVSAQKLLTIMEQSVNK